MVGRRAGTLDVRHPAVEPLNLVAEYGNLVHPVQGRGVGIVIQHLLHRHGGDGLRLQPAFHIGIAVHRNRRGSVDRDSPEVFVGHVTGGIPRWPDVFQWFLKAL